MKKLFFYIFIFFISVLIALVIFEIFIATANLSNKFELKKNLHLKLREPEKIYTYNIPANKLARFNNTIKNETLYKRIGKYQEQLSEGNRCETDSKIIFFIGSSTTENDYIPEENRFVNLFTKKINTLTDEKFCVFNYGVGGNILLNAKSILYTYGSIIKPDYVITMFNGTDLGYLIRNNDYNFFDDGERRFFDTTSTYPSSNLNLVKEFLKNNFSKTYFLVKNSVDALKSDADQVKIDELQWNIDQIYEKFERQYLEFIKLINFFESSPIVMLEARNPLLENSEYQLNIKKHYADQGIKYEKFMLSHDHINSKLKEKLSKEKVKFIDLRGLNSNELMYDEGHHNIKGNELISEILLNFFINELDY